MEQFQSTHKYEEEAKKYLNYFKMQLSFENIGIVKNWLMRADFKYKDGIGTREGFRYFYAKCACKTINRDQKRVKYKLPGNYKLFDNIEYKNYKTTHNCNIEELIRGSNYLTNFEKEVLIQHFLNKNSIKNISEDTKKSKQYISRVKNTALKKLRSNES